MGSLLVAVFDDESGARGGAETLRSLHGGGVLTLYALATVARDARGAGLVPRMSVGAGEGAAAPSVGAAVGALVSLLGGPLAAATRTLASGLVGAVRDLDEAGLGAGFLEQASRALRPGGWAVVAEAEEYRQLPVDARIAARGGRIFRHRLVGALAEARIVREVAALRGEIARLRIEQDDAEKTPLGRTVRRARALELKRSVRRASVLATALRREAAAKVAVLRAQAARLEGAARLAVEDRAATVRACLEARASSLDRLEEVDAAPIPAAPRARCSPGARAGDS